MESNAALLAIGNVLLTGSNVGVLGIALLQSLHWNQFLKEGLAGTMVHLAISVLMQLALSFFATCVFSLLPQSPPPWLLLTAGVIFNILCVATIFIAVGCSFTITSSIHQLLAATVDEIRRLTAHYQQEEARTALESLQRSYACCGTQGFDEWRRSAANLTQFSAPVSCCLVFVVTVVFVMAVLANTLVYRKHKHDHRTEQSPEEGPGGAVRGLSP